MINNHMYYASAYYAFESFSFIWEDQLFRIARHNNIFLSEL